MNSNGSTKRVLIIDDHATTRLLCKKFLQNAGYDVIEAENGRKGVEAFEQQQIDLVLTDVNMPEMDGFMVCNHIRLNPKGHDIPIIVMTSQDDVDSITKALEVGATDFIIKPIKWIILVHRLGYLLRAYDNFLKLRHNQQSLKKAQRIAHLGNGEWNVKDGDMQWSDEIYNILELDPNNHTSNAQQLNDLIHVDDRNRVQTKLNQAIETCNSLDIEYRIVTHTQKEKIVALRLDVIAEEMASEQTASFTLQDITMNRRSEQEMYYITHYDQLTGLPNREFFSEILHQALKEAERYSRQVAVLFLNIDRFKSINDTFGHGLGDKLLKIVGDRLLTSVRESDIVGHGQLSGDGNFSVARFGGDAFTILLKEIASSMDVAKAAHRIIKFFEEPIYIDEHEIYVHISIGAAICPSDGDTMETLLKNADLAMFHAKSKSRDKVVFYSDQMNQKARERFTLESGLQKALERNELIPYYQPKN